jgi:hypothetical protein
MADQDTPNQNANKSKAEGDRWTSDADTVRKADRDEDPARLYDSGRSGNAGGITNRPLSEEVGNQDSLPDRGTNRDRRTNNPDATRPEGDYTEKDR